MARTRRRTARARGARSRASLAEYNPALVVTKPLVGAGSRATNAGDIRRARVLPVVAPAPRARAPRSRASSRSSRSTSAASRLRSISRSSCASSTTARGRSSGASVERRGELAAVPRARHRARLLARRASTRRASSVPAPAASSRRCSLVTVDHARVRGRVGLSAHDVRPLRDGVRAGGARDRRRCAAATRS